MYSTVPGPELKYATRPLRYRSLQTLLLLSVLGSLVCSYWLLPSRLERVMAALERGDQPMLELELTHAADRPTDPGETRALADVALTLGEPAVAATILEQSLVRQPDSLTAMRRLLDIQRQRHRMRDVAALDERIYALNRDPEALRDAADIYASQRRIDDRIDALRRLNGIGHATPADIAELAHRLSDAGAGREAATLVTDWLDRWTKPLPAEVVALAAWLSASDADAEMVAKHLGTLIGRSGDPGALHVLIQTYAERGHPNLSLSAGSAIGEEMQATPEVALPLAQLEALQGQFTSARRRLDALDRAGKLLPAGLPMLADLSLQVGDVTRAAALTGAITGDQMPDGLPHRLVDAVFATGRMDVLSHLDIETIAGGSPGSAAVVALAQGDRARAQALANRALSATADMDDLGPAFGGLAKTFGLERATVSRLLSAAKTGALNDQELSLLIDLTANSHQEGIAVMQALRAQRDLTPKAGIVWATAAARTGRIPEVTAWLQDHAGQMPTDTLLELLQVATENANLELGRVTVSALSGRSDLPDGWTTAEVKFALNASRPMTAVRLRDGLDLIGNPQTTTAARNRIVASLVAERDFTRVARGLVYPPTAAAIEWLVDAASQMPSSYARIAQLGLLATLAPHQSLPLLASVWTIDPRHLLPLYVAALVRDHQLNEAQAVLVAGLNGMAPKQQDAVLYDAIAGVETSEALPILRFAARLGRDEWVVAYQDALTRAGLLDELRAGLRAQGSASELSSARRLAIASRLVELNDRMGAIAILEKLAAGLPPKNPIVEQLVFLWGPRATSDSIKWTHDRAIESPISDLPKWLDHLAYLGAPRTVIDVVGARPAILTSSAHAVRTYGASLVAADVTGAPNLAAAIASKPAPDVSAALAQLALDTGQVRPAWNATRVALSSVPSDPDTLLLAAQSSAAMRRSSEAAILYARLLALGPQDAAVMIDAGDAMLTAKQVEAGRRVLRAALLRLPAEPRTVVSARQRARALSLLRRTNEAVALLQLWSIRFPSDAGLQADLLQSRLDRTASD